MSTVRIASLALLCLSSPLLAQRIDVSIPASHDVTLYEDANGLQTNDAGPSLYVGENGTGLARRALLAFDVQSHVPANSHVIFAQLLLTISQSPQGAQPVPATLHRVLDSWNEGASVAPPPGGTGAPPAPGDSTWLHRNYPLQLWATAGGVFANDASAAVALPVDGVLAIGSTTGMVQDVQGWLNGSLANHGWLLKTDELGVQTARRLHSRETTFVGVEPVLQIAYVPAGGSYSRGTGCPGSNGLALAQSVVGAPVRMQIASLVVQNGLPGQPTAALIATTFGQVRADILPGCPWELDTIWFQNLGPQIMTDQGTTIYTFGIPNIPSIVGFPLAFQSVGLDFGVPFSLTFSNGSLIVFG